MVFIIAEIGVNHDGNYDKAIKMIDGAAKCGVNAVKFQSFKADQIVSRNIKQADYQKKNLNYETSQYEMLRKLELSFDEIKSLKEYSEEKGLEFLSSPFDLQSLDFLIELDIQHYKVASGEITNYPLIKKIAQTNKPILLSTGMCSLSEIEKAINIIKENGSSEITVLQCNTEYPTPYEDVNLNVMSTIQQAFNVKVGYSDHTIGDEVPIAAVSLGAKVIEKHFTINSNDEGPDHKASMESKDFKVLVDKIRNVEKALGSYVKKPTPSEVKNKSIVRKKMLAANNIKEGEVFDYNNIALKRHDTGLDAAYIELIIGRKALREYREGDVIEI